MILRDRMFGFALCLAALCAPAIAADQARALPLSAAAPFAVPHTLNLELDFRASRRARSLGNLEHYDFLDLTPGLAPLPWPRAGDMRSRLLTPELKRTPLFGWIAENLYRSSKEDGWCVEVDPGGGEYIIFYRSNWR